MSCNNQSQRLSLVLEHNYIMVSLILFLLTTSFIVPATARITSMGQQKQVGERSVFANIARELLSHLVASTREKRDAEEGSMVGDMAREGATLGLMAYMAFEHEDDCIERLVCDVTERLQLMSNSMGLFVTAIDFVTPEEYKALVNVAKEAANGASCFYYKCGALPYHAYNDDDDGNY